MVYTYTIYYILIYGMYLYFDTDNDITIKKGELVPLKTGNNGSYLQQFFDIPCFIN